MVCVGSFRRSYLRRGKYFMDSISTARDSFKWGNMRGKCGSRIKKILLKGFSSRHKKEMMISSKKYRKVHHNKILSLTRKKQQLETYEKFYVKRISLQGLLDI